MFAGNIASDQLMLHIQRQHSLAAALGFLWARSFDAHQYGAHVSDQVEDLKDKLARSLADMENLRERTARATEQSRTFAIQVCSLLSHLQSHASISPCQSS